MFSFRRLALFTSAGCLATACAVGSELDDTSDGGPQGDAGASSSSGDAGTSNSASSGGSSSSGESSSGSSSSSGSGPCTADLKINEVQTRGSDPADEFIEIFNAASCEVNFSDFAVVYRSANNSAETPIFTGNVTIAAGGYAVFAGTKFNGQNQGRLSSGLGDDGQAGLRDLGGNRIVDSVAWGSVSNGQLAEGSPAPKAAANRSIARIPNGSDTNNNSNDFRVANSPTPGGPN